MAPSCFSGSHFIPATPGGKKSLWRTAVGSRHKASTANLDSEDVMEAVEDRATVCADLAIDSRDKASSLELTSNPSGRSDQDCCRHPSVLNMVSICVGRIERGFDMGWRGTADRLEAVKDRGMVNEMGWNLGRRRKRWSTGGGRGEEGLHCGMWLPSGLGLGKAGLLVDRGMGAVARGLGTRLLGLLEGGCNWTTRGGCAAIGNNLSPPHWEQQFDLTGPSQPSERAPNLQYTHNSIRIEQLRTNMRKWNTFNYIPTLLSTLHSDTNQKDLHYHPCETCTTICTRIRQPPTATRYLHNHSDSQEHLTSTYERIAQPLNYHPTQRTHSSRKRRIRNKRYNHAPENLSFISTRKGIAQKSLRNSNNQTQKAQTIYQTEHKQEPQHAEACQRIAVILGPPNKT